jgi:hypothetical protein
MTKHLSWQTPSSRFSFLILWFVLFGCASKLAMGQQEQLEHAETFAKNALAVDLYGFKASYTHTSNVIDLDGVIKPIFFEHYFYVLEDIKQRKRRTTFPNSNHNGIVQKMFWSSHVEIKGKTKKIDGVRDTQTVPFVHTETFFDPFELAVCRNTDIGRIKPGHFFATVSEAKLLEKGELEKGSFIYLKVAPYGRCRIEFSDEQGGMPVRCTWKAAWDEKTMRGIRTDDEALYNFVFEETTARWKKLEDRWVPIKVVLNQFDLKRLPTRTTIYYIRWLSSEQCQELAQDAFESRSADSFRLDFDKMLSKNDNYPN